MCCGNKGFLQRTCKGPHASFVLSATGKALHCVVVTEKALPVAVIRVGVYVYMFSVCVQWIDVVCTVRSVSIRSGFSDKLATNCSSLVIEGSGRCGKATHAQFTGVTLGGMQFKQMQ